MASALSYEYYVSKLGVASGVATLDSSGYIPVGQLPPSAVETYKGQYADYAAIVADYPSASLADYAYNDDTTSYWYWNANLATPAWVNQQIAEADYLLLTASEIAGVPYIVVV
jgi:hypothetical protein